MASTGMGTWFDFRVKVRLGLGLGLGLGFGVKLGWDHIQDRDRFGPEFTCASKSREFHPIFAKGGIHRSEILCFDTADGGILIGLGLGFVLGLGLGILIDPYSASISNRSPTATLLLPLFGDCNEQP